MVRFNQFHSLREILLLSVPATSLKKKREGSLTCVSISNIHIFPDLVTSLTDSTEDPYKFPLNSACSINPSRSTKLLNASRLVKWYETPFCSPGLGARVVSNHFTLEKLVEIL